ncbi:MAG: FAD-dependent oxidoreductase [Clostridia bacterium]|nr:FAD-dependent oxidoreductase [Clostridia bacterium]
MAKDIIIPVEVGGITFKNPFYVASGPTTKSVKQLQRIEETGWAAASIKLTIDPAPYINRKPRYAMFNDRNALAFTTEKRLTFVEGLKLMEDSKKVLTDLKLMANITYAGDEGVAGWVNMAKKFEEVGADIIELNMCCPNMSYNLELTSGSEGASQKKTGASLGQQGDAVAEIVREIKKNISIPLFVKLTPEGGKIAKVAQSLYAAGADAVGGTSNRMAIPPINLDHPEKAYYHLQDEISMSCHCGPWLKPLAQRDTYEIRKVNGMDPAIMQAGGITNWKDAVEMVMCGANLLGVCAETLISGYDIVRPMISGMKNYMDEHGYTDLSQFRGIIVPQVKTATEVTLYGGYARIKEPNLAGPCKDACPHHVPAQAYIQKVAKGEYRDAFDLITSKGPLQGVCSLVCSHPCEEACTRGINGRPVQIRDIKRFVLEYGKEQGWERSFKVDAANGHRAAIIGSGPAGLACAAHLCQAGYDVTVFEREAALGGMLRYGIPKFRMQNNVIDEEVNALKDMGVKFQTGVTYGKDITADSLKAEGFDAIFVGIGAQAGNKLGIEGETADGVMDAVDLLKAVTEEKDVNIGKRVVVIGGGFTAVDAARTAVRLGAEEVIIAYRRTRDEMTATAEEIAEAEAEGIKVMYLVAPDSIATEGNKVVAINMTNQVLGDVDNDARRRPEKVSGASFSLPCDTVISAIGQKVEEASAAGMASNRGMIEVDGRTGATSIPGVYAGGDAVKVANVISAIAMGKRAAVSMDQYVRGADATLTYTEDTVCVDPEKVLRRVGYFKDEKENIDTQVRSGAERNRDFDTYTRALTEEEAKAEASRCLNCGCGEGCQLCKTICCDFAPFVEKADTMCIDKDSCVACGMCFNRCPNKNIEMFCTGETV